MLPKRASVHEAGKAGERAREHEGDEDHRARIGRPISAAASGLEPMA